MFHGLFILRSLFLHCHAAGAVAEIQTVCFVNIEFRERKKLILNQVSSFNCLNQLNVNRQYPIRAHWSIVTVAVTVCFCSRIVSKKCTRCSKYNVIFCF
jgi:hypothetical protein